jgi:hypothetical protein
MSIHSPVGSENVVMITHGAQGEAPTISSHSTGQDTDVGLVLSTEGQAAVSTASGVRFGVGVSDPQISLALEDNDTGLNQAGENELALYTGGGERVRVDASGNVGIGTNDPKSKISINGDLNFSAGNKFIGFNTYHDGSNWRRVSTGYPGILKYDGSGDFYFANNESDTADTTFTLSTKFKIKNNGNVGIGTTTPDSLLHVESSSDASDVTVLHLKSTQNASGRSFSTIKLEKGTNYGGLIKGFLKQGDYGGLGLFTLDGGTEKEVMTLKPKAVEITQPTYQQANGYGGYGLQMTNGDGSQIWYMMIENGSGGYGSNLLFCYNGLRGYIHTTGSGQMNFTGQHRCLMNNNTDITKEGLIVSATNNIINVDNGITPTVNESLPYCVVTSTDYDKRVFGVISGKEDTSDNRSYTSGNFVSVYQKENTNEERLHINSVGEGGLWVCNKNGTLDGGDYIVSSSVVGYGMKQTLNEGLLANYTVAKITTDCPFSLTKIVKQKLKVITSTDAEGNTTTVIDYDINGDVQYEDDLDEQGNQQMIYPLETRFLDANGNLLVDEADYNTRLGNGESVYIACFVGCTYHCG